VKSALDHQAHSVEMESSRWGAGGRQDRTDGRAWGQTTSRRPRRLIAILVERTLSERDSGLEAGVAGSFERQSQGSAGRFARAILSDGWDFGGATDSLRDDVLEGPQQQTVQTRFRQQGRIPFPGVGFDDDADASLAANSVPTTAVKAIAESRKLRAKFSHRNPTESCPAYQLGEIIRRTSQMAS